MAVATAPRYARAHLNLGIALEALGHADAAVAAYRTALEIDASDPFANYNLGKLLATRGAPAEGIERLQEAIASRPDFPEAYVVLSNLFDARGEPEAALRALQTALEYKPGYAGAWFNAGVVLSKLKRDVEAESALRRAIGIEPRLLEAHSALFHLCQAHGNKSAALQALEDALSKWPDWVEARYNYGVLLMDLGREVEAEIAFRRVLALDPAFMLAYRMLGAILPLQSRIAELLALVRAGRGRFPDNLELESLEIFALNFSDELSAEDLFARHRAYGVRLEQATPARPAIFTSARDPNRRIRIGYVSGDFSYHPVAQFLVPVLEHHDRSRYETYCYSVGTKLDEFTQQVATRTDVWRPVAALSETELAEVIARDAIDVLIDLSGHSGISRLGVFARQPSPVQAAWLGYLNTTGMTRVQYRITDRISDPPGLAERLHTERLVRLPHSQWCYRPFVMVPEAVASPCARSGFVTFGSFNQISKLSPSARKLWVQILHRLPDARLLIMGLHPGRAREALLQSFERDGVAAERISLVPHLPVADYYGTFGKVDIALDSMPYSGGTTTCDSLWMGVPVITAPGERSASRSAASILTTLGLTDWIAATPQEYVELAVKRASESQRLAVLRSTLRQRMRVSPLMDEPTFARDLERILRSMWRNWCDYV